MDTRAEQFNKNSVLGLFYVFIGFLFLLLNYPVCTRLKNIFVEYVLFQCMIYSLFIGIIFIVCGAVIIITFGPKN